jgi:hypothetical protein
MSLIQKNGSPEFHLGITGSRNMPNGGPQYETFTRIIGIIAECPWLISGENTRPFHVHHGCCIGADEIAHYKGREIGAVIHGHPGMLQSGASLYRMEYTEFDKLYQVKPYGARNKDIVKCGSGGLLAAPAYHENDKRSRRSGTWQTIRIAHKQNRRIIIVWPDGEITEA